MPIERIVVAPIPTTDCWAVYQVAADSIPIDAVVWPYREQAVNYAREQGRQYQCPVVTYPKGD